MDRNCDKCIHHITGSCSKWSCKFKSVEMVKADVIEEILNRIDEGVCEFCKHGTPDDTCAMYCSENDSEKETFIEWLKTKKEEYVRP